MILITLVVVGLLSLSTVALRSASRGNAMQLARSNARMALIVAIGELQKHAGDDRRISAPADLVEEDAGRGITGIWDSWQPEQQGGDYDDKDSYFRRWLISLRDSERASDPVPPSFASEVSQILVGEGTLGEALAKDLDRNQVVAERVPVSNGSGKGHFAYAVLDDGIKGRMNLRKGGNKGTLASHVSSMGASSRDALWMSEGLDTFRLNDKDADRLVTRKQAKLILESSFDMGTYFHDYCTTSSGLMTNAGEGGLKEDLSLLFDQDLPDQYSGSTLYAARMGQANDPADPKWSYLQSFATTYKNLTNLPGGPGVKSALLNSRDAIRLKRASTGQTFHPQQPSEAILSPIVARVELVFSLLTRNAHGGWPGAIGDSKKPYMLHMIYSPVVTLWNPYNVPLSFAAMEVEFKDLPVGFKFFVNRREMNTSFAPLDRLYVRNQHGGASKSFGFKVKEDVGSRGSGLSTLGPGETRVFGVTASPDWTWAQDRVGDGNTIFDWRDDKTSSFIAGRGWSEGQGFDIDWLSPGDLKSTNNKSPGGIIAVGMRDRIDVEFTPTAPGKGPGIFSVDVSLMRSSTDRRPQLISRFEVEYGDIQTLKKGLEMVSDPGAGIVAFPRRLERPVVASRIWEADSRKISDYIHTLPFAAFSVRGKTAIDSNEPARTWVDHNPTVRMTRIDLSRAASQGIYSSEVALRSIESGAGSENSVGIDVADRGFYFSGHSSQTGTTVSAALELPLAPLQSVAQLRHANLTNSGYLPYTTYTVGESRLHPLLKPNGVRVASPFGYDYLDHTWLANDALWDRYFFSTICAEEGLAFGGSGRSRTQVLSDFFSSSAPLANQRFAPILSSGTTDDAIAQVDGNDGWRKAAAYLLQHGTFNVNSTSVEAWRAVLAGLDGETVRQLILDGDNANNVGEWKDRDSPITGAAFPRVRRPLEEGMDEAAAEFERRLRWRGFRQLGGVTSSGSGAELDLLAEQIVEEVRLRGPFLSMAEFVNRQLRGIDNKSVKGALQAAIDESITKKLVEVDSVRVTPASVSEYGYTTPEAALGWSADGGPADITQGDILSLIGSHISVRSDTFTIRAYGDAVDKSGRVQARAWCEATVQRLPDFVDDSQPADTLIEKLDPVNEQFGRRFEIIKFRWLSAEEV